jgi:hypothetical protein
MRPALLAPALFVLGNLAAAAAPSCGLLMAARVLTALPHGRLAVDVRGDRRRRCAGTGRHRRAGAGR